MRAFPWSGPTPRRILRTGACLAILVAALAFVCPLAGAQAQAEAPPDTIVIPPITRTQPAVTTIAIPTFDVTGNAPGLDAGEFHRTVYRDLQWFSDFTPVANQQFAEQTHRAERASGRIDYAEWQRLRANFVLKGEVEVVGGVMTLDYRLFNVDLGEQTLGLRYRDVAVADLRRLAHTVSNDIIRAVFDDVGIANTQIVFVSQRARPGQKEVWIMDADGHNQRPLTNDRSLAATPCWGKNGGEIYYTTYKEYNPDLRGLLIGTAQAWWVSQRPNLNFAPNWCARTERIVLTLGKDGNSEIYTMNRDGRNETRLTYTAAIDSSPCWNPAGNQIVFTSDRTGYPQIHVMDADGTNVRRLTRMGRYNDSASWSPRGDRIAFVARDRNIFDIYTMKIDGTDWRQLTTKTGNNEDPQYAPDGKHIVFASNRSGRFQIYIMRDDGTNVQQLTYEGINQSAAWGPLR